MSGAASGTTTPVDRASRRGYGRQMSAAGQVQIVAGRDPVGVERLLRSLPDWFGIEEAIRSYVADAGDARFGSLLALDRGGEAGLGGSCVGVVLTRRHFDESAEIHLIAVAASHRGQGIGRRLVERAVDELAGDGVLVVSVHTVGPSFEHAGYAHTRGFYRALGFVPIEEHDGLDWSGPTVIMVRPMGRSR